MNSMDILSKFVVIGVWITLPVWGVFCFYKYSKGYGSVKPGLIFSGFFVSPNEATRYERKLLLITSLLSILISAIYLGILISLLIIY